MFNRLSIYLLSLAFLSLAISCGTATNRSADSSFNGYTFTSQSAAITYALMGVAANGTATAGVDPASMITSSNQVRLIFTGPAGTLLSALSTDGLTFTVDSGFTSPFSVVGIAQPTIIASPTGGFRMFARQDTRVFSATSSDGQTWTQESGTRFDVSSMGLSSTTGPSLVHLSNGQYRMYFSPEPTNCASAGVTNSIYSAISNDQLTWTADSGVRVGDSVDGRCKNKPSAIVQSNGLVTLFYHVYSRTGSGDSYSAMIYYSTSTSSDGLTFTTETSTALGATSPTSAGLTEATDPNILQMPDGTMRLYFDVFYAPNGDQIYASSGVVN